MPQEAPPTRSLDTLKKWSRRYGWGARAVVYDAAVTEPQKQALEEEKQARRRQLMEEGLAQAHERLARLTRLADFLEDQIYEEGENADGDRIFHNVWMPDAKWVGPGPFGERVDVERFNGPLIDQFRGVLDDIAKEVGGRKAGPAGAAAEVPPPSADLSALSAEELVQLDLLLAKLHSRPPTG
jgi:hypothetical protein